ncbi:MAG: hypothetical protein ABIL09_00940, partial [Gemmatimonadota bacterium]
GPFAAAAAALSAAARQIPPVAGSREPVRLPGDRGAACRAARLQSGIPVPERSWRRLRERLEACGVAVGEEGPGSG